ncbi:hypothetical protein QTP88_010721 [Uroleucon formosanum]
MNMRVQLQNDPTAQVFSKQLLDIGNGEIELHQNTQYIKLPDIFCTVVETRNELIESVFPDILNYYLDHNWLCNHAILAARNVDVNEINFHIQQILPGDLVSFKSIDTVIDENKTVNFPTEFLNSLDLPGMPPHNLQLKIGSPIILLRNLNPPQLCNGTRLVIKKMTENILEATILSGKFKGDIVLLPRIPLMASESPIPFKRLQFPICLAFAMTINKSQGQTMSICGIDRYLQEDNDNSVVVNYEGRLNNLNWCSCGYCKGMLSDIECLCCNELPNLEKIRNQERKCITLHQSFSKLILDKEILNITRHNLILKTKNRINKKKLGQHHPENKTWRFICYKQYTSWVNSWIAMGRGNRVVLPACVEQKIREEYPEPNGIYVGFKNSKNLPA